MIDDHSYDGNHINGFIDLSNNKNDDNSVRQPLLYWALQAGWIDYYKKNIFFTGESNSDWNQALYGCTFPEMINEWRRKWSENSPTNSKFPFGFVQLAAWRENFVGTGFPVIRWHQTADIGYVPNEVMEVYNLF